MRKIKVYAALYIKQLSRLSEKGEFMDSNCYVVIYRTTLFYIILLIVFKLMGKREIGQLTLLDLVVSVLMAEIAAMAIDT